MFFKFLVIISILATNCSHYIFFQFPIHKFVKVTLQEEKLAYDLTPFLVQKFSKITKRRACSVLPCIPFLVNTCFNHWFGYFLLLLMCLKMLWLIKHWPFFHYWLYKLYDLRMTEIKHFELIIQGFQLTFFRFKKLFC